MTLWKKETDGADAPFVDLFADKIHLPNYIKWNHRLSTSEFPNEFGFVNPSEKFHPGKNNRISEVFRVYGNHQFEKKDWFNAMEHYNISLCFAELGTDNVSLAYANRAACFLMFEEYNNCLRDIELAEKGNYPNITKLMERKTRCQRLMKGAKQEDMSPYKLSFEPCVKFPCLANVLEIQRNEEFGRHAIANTDIDVGKTILIEKSLISLGFASDRVQCYNCVKDEQNFLACAGCTDVMFCSEECRNENTIHKQFCGATINRMPVEIRYVAESLLLGIVEFSSANEMMSFVEETLAKRFIQVPNRVNDSRSKYSMFLSLKPTAYAMHYEEIYKIYTALLDNPFIASMFRTMIHQRFLMHLVAEHWAIMYNNSFGISETGGGCIIKKLGLVMSLFNHSCAPNLLSCTNDAINTTAFITRRPIKKGEQLCISYVPKGDDCNPTFLQENYNFCCKCDRCEPHCKPSDRSMMKADLNYQFLVSLPEQEHKSSIVKDKCETFLRKFGHLPWSDEMEVVLKMYSP